MAAGAIQRPASWGKRRAMRIAPPARRRRSPLPIILIVLAVLLVALLVWLSTRNTEVPTQRIEQDVTNEALAH
jgi:O-antigen ligase